MISRLARNVQVHTRVAQHKGCKKIYTLDLLGQEDLRVIARSAIMFPHFPFNSDYLDLNSLQNGSRYADRIEMHDSQTPMTEISTP